jgi:hypothetical protein
MDSAVGGNDQLKLPFDRVAEGNAVLLVPESKGIKKGCRVGTLELQRPRLAAVAGFVNAGSVALAGAEQVGRGVTERLDIAEVEFFCAGDGSEGSRLGRGISWLIWPGCTF